MTQRSSSEAVLAAMVLADGLTSSFGRAEIPLNDGPPPAWDEIGAGLQHRFACAAKAAFGVSSGADPGSLGETAANDHRPVLDPARHAELIYAMMMDVLCAAEE